ncbi:hypothetical protein COTS27_00802 [Spirochaetota bacterium]|nr:hypothetical protein COTS27_00802 [Spirochaetota bacterium]
MEQKTASQFIKTFQSKYLLDANCFINLERFYPHDVFRSLDKIIRQNIQSEKIQTIDAVYNQAQSSIINILFRSLDKIIKQNIQSGKIQTIDAVHDKAKSLITNILNHHASTLIHHKSLPKDEQISKSLELILNDVSASSEKEQISKSLKLILESLESILKPLKKKLILDNSSASRKIVSEHVKKEIIKIADYYINKKDKKVKSRRDIQEINQDFMGMGGSDELAADGLLIAKAIDMRITVVTAETKSGPMAKKIKIPNVCEEFDVDYINFTELLKKESVAF